MNRFRYPKAAVDKAIKYLKTKKGPAPSFIEKFPGKFSHRQGKLYAGKLHVIPTEERDEFLRKVVHGKTSEYPFGRDSLFGILKNEVLNVSKRDVEAFLNSQGPLVHRRARPKKEKRENLRKIRKAGILSMDLAHVKADDFENVLGTKGYDYMGAPGKKGYQQDRYFLNAVDLLTGYLLTEVLQGKTAQLTWKKIQVIIDRYESKFWKVRQIEVDYGGEFKGNEADEEENIEALSIKDELKKRKIRLLRRTTNATVEQKNAHMQRVFWAIVAQRRGGFKTSVKQAVKISNRTLNRRTGLTPEDAMQALKDGKKVAQKEPKAGPTDRKKALPIGTKVRTLKKKFARGKGDDIGYKAYKGLHYEAVLPIEKIKFYGVHPRYKVGKKWHWGDELITARPEDTKSHNLYIKRPLILPPKMIPRKKIVVPKAKPKPKIGPKKPAKPKFSKYQDVTIKREGRNVTAKVHRVTKDKIVVRWYSNKQKKHIVEDILKSTAIPQRTYEITDEVLMFIGGNKWVRGEVDKHEAQGQYRVFWTEDNERVSKIVSGAYLKPAS